MNSCAPAIRRMSFFVVGFNDRPAVLVDYTSDVDDVEARMVMLKPENRTALIDAMYLAVNKLKDAKNQRRALLVIFRWRATTAARYTQGELERTVRESEVQIYSIGIFDAYAPTEEEQNGPGLLKDVSEATGGRLFKVLDLQDLSDIAERISEDLRNEYVLGYTPTDKRRNGRVPALACAADSAARVADPVCPEPRGLLCANPVAGGALWAFLAILGCMKVAAGQTAPNAVPGPPTAQTPATSPLSVDSDPVPSPDPDRAAAPPTSTSGAAQWRGGRTRKTADTP